MPRRRSPSLARPVPGEDTSDGTWVGAKVGVENKRFFLKLGVSQDGCGHQLPFHEAEGSNGSGILM